MATNYDLASIGVALDITYNLLLSSYIINNDNFLTIKKRNDLGIYNNSIIWPFCFNQSLSSFGALSSTPTVSFVRSSSATRVNSKGVIEVVGNNVPRFDYDPITLQPKGLLIENTRGNYSPALTNWITAFTTISANVLVTLAPDNTYTACKIIPTTTNNYHGIYSNLLLPTPGTYIYSVFLKKGEYNSIQLKIGSNTSSKTVNSDIDLTNGTVIGSFASPDATVSNVLINSYQNNWFRVSLAVNLGTDTSLNIQLLQLGDGGSVVYTGDGVSGTYAWGAQYEQTTTPYNDNTYPSSYIPTTSLTATRFADNAWFETQLSSFFNPNNGTWAVEWSVPGVPPSFSRLISWNNQPRTILGYTGTDQIITLNNLGQQNTITTNKPLTGVPNRAAFTYTAAGSLSGYSMALNGGPVLNSTFAPFGSTVSQIYVGGRFDETKAWINGWIRQLEYYNTTIPGSTLQALTLSA
jgi:hypothetical protein